MKRPRPVRSAASSTRSTDWPHQLVVTSAIPSDIPRCALFGAIAENAVTDGGSGAIPSRLISYRKVSFPALGASAGRDRRATWRNSLGLTPA